MKKLTSALLTGLTVLGISANSLEARASADERRYSVNANIGVFMPTGELLNDLYGAGSKFNINVVKYVAPEIGLELGFGYYTQSGDTNKEVKRGFLGDRLIHFDGSDITIMSIPIGVRLMPSSSFYIKGGFEFTNISEIVNTFDEYDNRHAVSETTKKSAAASGVFGGAGFRMPINRRKDKNNSYFTIEVEGSSAKLNDESQKDVGGVSGSVGLEFDIN